MSNSPDAWFGLIMIGFLACLIVAAAASMSAAEAPAPMEVQADTVYVETPMAIKSTAFDMTCYFTPEAR